MCYRSTLAGQGRLRDLDFEGAVRSVVRSVLSAEESLLEKVLCHATCCFVNHCLLLTSVGPLSMDIVISDMINRLLQKTSVLWYTGDSILSTHVLFLLFLSIFYSIQTLPDEAFQTCFPTFQHYMEKAWDHRKLQRNEQKRNIAPTLEILWMLLSHVLYLRHLEVVKTITWSRLQVGSSLMFPKSVSKWEHAGISTANAFISSNWIDRCICDQLILRTASST